MGDLIVFSEVFVRIKLSRCAAIAASVLHGAFSRLVGLILRVVAAKYRIYRGCADNAVNMVPSDARNEAEQTADTAATMWAGMAHPRLARPLRDTLVNCADEKSAMSRKGQPVDVENFIRGN